MEKVSQLMGLGGGEACQEESRLLAARCLAEQAYVQPYDVELDGEDGLRERLGAALSLYNRALDHAGDLVRPHKGPLPLPAFLILCYCIDLFSRWSCFHAALVLQLWHV